MTLKNTAVGRYDQETGHLDKYEARQYFDCETLNQLCGLLEFMIATSETELDMTIARRDEKDD